MDKEDLKILIDEFEYQQHKTRNCIALLCIYIAVTFFIFAFFLVRLPEFRIYYYFKKIDRETDGKLSEAIYNLNEILDDYDIK